VKECELIISDEVQALKQISNYKARYNNTKEIKDSTESLIFSENNLSFKFIQAVDAKYFDKI